MHGVSDKFVSEAFTRFGFAPYIPVTEQQQPDPEFPTVKFPNPEEKGDSYSEWYYINVHKCYKTHRRSGGNSFNCFLNTSWPLVVSKGSRLKDCWKWGRNVRSCPGSRFWSLLCRWKGVRYHFSLNANSKTVCCRLDGEWITFTGDQLGVIFGHRTFEFYKSSGKLLNKLAMVVSTVSSKMLEEVAKVEGFKLVECLTGECCVKSRSDSEWCCAVSGV